jgi:hypothetical protein
LDRYVDALIGYELHHHAITDPQVIAASGSNRHPILCGRPTQSGPPAWVYVFGG